MQKLTLGCSGGASAPGMAYRFNLADNQLPIFDQSRLSIANILSVLSFSDIDN